MAVFCLIGSIFNFLGVFVKVKPVYKCKGMSHLAYFFYNLSSIQKRQKMIIVKILKKNQFFFIFSQAKQHSRAI